MLRADIGKLAALVDHYYAAYRETASLLERRDSELAELRNKLKLRPSLLPSVVRFTQHFDKIMLDVGGEPELCVAAVQHVGLGATFVF